MKQRFGRAQAQPLLIRVYLRHLRLPPAGGFKPAIVSVDTLFP